MRVDAREVFTWGHFHLITFNWPDHELCNWLRANEVEPNITVVTEVTGEGGLRVEQFCTDPQCSYFRNYLEKFRGKPPKAGVSLHINTDTDDVCMVVRDLPLKVFPSDDLLRRWS